ncbi:MAG: hypothetical protein SVX43_20325 [Cyanobacteriota bacterium]|nr:hypothetical protein [Cyanobacteriota bacterium]
MRSKTIELFLAIGLAATLAACQGGTPEGGGDVETVPDETEAPVDAPADESLEESPEEPLEESPADESLEETPAEDGEGGEGGEGS